MYKFMSFVSKILYVAWIIGMMWFLWYMKDISHRFSSEHEDKERGRVFLGIAITYALLVLLFSVKHLHPIHLLDIVGIGAMIYIAYILLSSSGQYKLIHSAWLPELISLVVLCMIIRSILSITGIVSDNYDPIVPALMMMEYAVAAGGELLRWVASKIAPSSYSTSTPSDSSSYSSPSRYGYGSAPAATMPVPMQMPMQMPYQDAQAGIPTSMPIRQYSPDPTALDSVLRLRQSETGMMPSQPQTANLVIDDVRMDDDNAPLDVMELMDGVDMDMPSSTGSVKRQKSRSRSRSAKSRA